jgi:hypothetical protein
MRPKLLIAVLALMLSGINCDAASICANRCMSSGSAESAVVHHHQMESQAVATNIQHHIHTRTHAAGCTECPPEVGNNLNRSADCQVLPQIEAIREASFSFDAPSGVAQVDVPHAPADALALADNGGPSFLCDIGHTIRSSDTASVPLRI